MAGKRVSLASLAASKVEVVPGAGRPDLVHVDPDTVAPTPLNPRRDFDPDGLEQLGEGMRDGQLQPCVAVPRSSYLRLYPEHADQLPEGCRYVMAAGERRWRAALKVGLDTLDVLVRHDLTESRIKFLSAVLSENVQRANFNPIEEANGLQALLTLHDGNQTAAAAAMKKSKQWFSQRIGLLRLTDEMVQLVVDGKLTAFREMRRYASMPADEQYTAWKGDQDRPPAPRTPAPAQPAAAPPEAPQAYTAVYAEPSSPPPGTAPEPGRTPAPSPETYTAVYTPPSGPPGAGPAVLEREIETGRPQPTEAAAPPVPGPRQLPDQSSAQGNDLEPAPAGPKKLPYDDGPYIGKHLALKMDEDAHLAMIDVSLIEAWDRYPERLDELLAKRQAERS